MATFYQQNYIVIGSENNHFTNFINTVLITAKLKTFAETRCS